MYTGLEGQSNDRFAGPLTNDHQSKHSGLGNSEVHVDPAHTLGSSPIPDTTEYAEAAQTPSVSTNGVGPASVPVDSPGGSAQVAEGEKPKKGHRRGRSLTGLIPTLKTKPKRSQSQVLEVCCACYCYMLLCVVHCSLWCAVLCCAVLQRLSSQEIQVLLLFDMMGRHHTSYTGQATTNYHVHDASKWASHHCSYCLSWLHLAPSLHQAMRLLMPAKQPGMTCSACRPSQPHQQQAAVRQVGQRRLMPRQVLLPPARLAALEWARRLRRPSEKKCLLALWALGTWVSVPAEQRLLCDHTSQMHLQSCCCCC